MFLEGALCRVCCTSRWAGWGVPVDERRSLLYDPELSEGYGNSTGWRRRRRGRGGRSIANGVVLEGKLQPGSGESTVHLEGEMAHDGGRSGITASMRYRTNI